MALRQVVVARCLVAQQRSRLPWLSVLDRPFHPSFRGVGSLLIDSQLPCEPIDPSVLWKHDVGEFIAKGFIAAVVSALNDEVASVHLNTKRETGCLRPTPVWAEALCRRAGREPSTIVPLLNKERRLIASQPVQWVKSGYRMNEARHGSEARDDGENDHR